MGLNLEYIYGQTPLDNDEKSELLIESISTRAELDEFEQKNIEDAIQWLQNSLRNFRFKKNLNAKKKKRIISSHPSTSATIHAFQFKPQRKVKKQSLHK